jgi:hypothetical protein
MKEKIQPFFEQLVILIKTNYPMLIFYIYALFQPTLKIFILVTLFMVLDFFTGWWKSVKKGESFQSRKMMESGLKAMVYFLLLITGFISAWVAEAPYEQCVQFLKGIAGFLCWVELKSIDENFKEVTGYSIFKQLSNALGKVFKRTPIKNNTES